MKIESLYNMTKNELINFIVSEKYGAITEPKKAVDYISTFSGLIKDWYQEHFLIIALNTKNKVLKAEIVSTGSLTACIAEPKQIFKKLLLIDGVASFIVAHNHPSGEVDPSENDNKITESLKKAGQILALPLFDHLIFTKAGDFYSYSEEGKI